MRSMAGAALCVALLGASLMATPAAGGSKGGPAHRGDGEVARIIRDCSADNHLDHRYSLKALRRALRQLPDDIARYTDCERAIRGAIARPGDGEHGHHGKGATVRTADGAVRGRAEGGHRLFQGIPYAAPPVGALRWRPPERVAPWSGVRDASQPGNECVQQATFWRPGSPASWHEDCLYLNVWAPQNGRRRLPVLVWFHGGGYVNGAATDVQPARLTEQGGNVVVTVNYRLGAMGFLAHGGLDAESADAQSSGNYGVLDQQEALRWIRRNIAAFGGDRDRVTIAGQSAGAGSVCYQLASPTAKGLFHRAVIQSGADCLEASHDTAVARGQTFAEALGCMDAAAVVACLRAKTPAQVIAAQAKTGLQWRPAVGGASQPLSALEAYSSGSFNQVPVIIGNTRHETRAFVYEGNDLVLQPLTAEGYEAAIRSQYGANAGRVLAEYPLSAYDAPGIAMAAVTTDAQFACPSVPIADALSARVTTFAYEFRDETAPGRPYMVIPPSFPLGSAHTSDVPYVWQTETNAPFTPAQRKLSRLMIGYWSRFARAGDPNAPALPTWPLYDATRQLRLGFLPGGATEVISGVAYAQDHHCAFWQSMT
jgi:para-nitrobenzyl esterase